MVFHDLQQCRAAIKASVALGRPVMLVTASGGADYAGPAYLKAVLDKARSACPEAQVEAMIDCGAAPGRVMAALRVGWRRLCFSGGADIAARLADIARQQDAILEAKRPEAFDPLGHWDVEAACRAWLAQD